MSREIITLTVASADNPQIIAQTQFTYEQWNQPHPGGISADKDISRLTTRVREQVGVTTPVAVAFEKGGKKFVRRA